MPVEYSNFLCPEVQIISQKDQCLAIMLLYVPKLFGIVLGVIAPCKVVGLFALEYPGLADLDVSYPFKFHVLLCPNKKISTGSVNPVKSFEVHVAPVYCIKGGGHEYDYIKYVDIVSLYVLKKSLLGTKSKNPVKDIFTMVPNSTGFPQNYFFKTV